MGHLQLDQQHGQQQLHDQQEHLTDQRKPRDQHHACSAVSFDAYEVHHDIPGALPGRGSKLTFHYSSRTQSGDVLERFTTEVALQLQPRPLTPAEELAVACLGVCHGNYAWLPFMPAARVFEVRAYPLSEQHLAYLEQQLQGALAEWCHLAGLDLRQHVRLRCCCSNDTSTSTTGDQSAVVQGEGGVNGDPAAAAAAAEVQREERSSPSSEGGEEGEEERERPRVLVPFGGGKDSTTLVELLHRLGCDVQWCYYGEWVGSWECYPKFARLVAASPCRTVLMAEQRQPCEARLQQLSMRPHLKVADYVAYVSFYTFTAALFALQHSYEYICVGNENSANAINLVDPKFGFPVNHQYEKSFEAERATHRFLQQHVAALPDAASTAPAPWQQRRRRLFYFSGLQHMTELEVARRFVALCGDTQLGNIISCNWATDDDWCGRCEKCAFVYVMFAAFLPPRRLLRTVWRRTRPADGLAGAEAVPDGGGSSDLAPRDASTASVLDKEEEADLVEAVRGCGGDLFDSEAHQGTFEQLMGVAGLKPLECVGTPDEVLAALYLASRTHYGDGGGGEEAAAPRYPRLIAKHLALIESEGRRAWAEIEGAMRGADLGESLGVETLYPAWYRLGAAS